MTLRTVLASLAEGATIEEVLEDFPTVTEASGSTARTTCRRRMPRTIGCRATRRVQVIIGRLGILVAFVWAMARAAGSSESARDSDSPTRWDVAARCRYGTARSKKSGWAPSTTLSERTIRTRSRE